MKFLIYVSLAFYLCLALPVFSLDKPLPNESTFHLLKSTLAIDPLPLNADVLDSQIFAGYSRQKLQFDGFDREKISAYLALPNEVVNPPVVILLHGLTQSKEQWWLNGGPWSFPTKHREVLLKKGFAVLAIDARNHGERKMSNDFQDPYTYLSKSYVHAYSRMVLETAMDVSRVIDYLNTRSDVDTNRIGLMGFSMGGNIAWAAAAIDNRVKSLVIMASPLNLSSNKAQWDLFSPVQFIPAIKNIPVLMLMAKADNFYTQADADFMFQQLHVKSKNLVFYEGGHDLPDSTIEASIPWLLQTL